MRWSLRRMEGQNGGVGIWCGGRREGGTTGRDAPVYALWASVRASRIQLIWSGWHYNECIWVHRDESYNFHPDARLDFERQLASVGRSLGVVL